MERPHVTFIHQNPFNLCVNLSWTLSYIHKFTFYWLHIAQWAKSGVFVQWVQYSTVQYSTVHCGTVQYSTVQYSGQWVYYQIFSQISQKYFLAQKNILSKKWPPKQNLKGVSKSYIGLCNHSGPLYKVTWWCLVVPELPKALLKMASGLISPSGLAGHRRQLCIDIQNVEVYINLESETGVNQ